MKKILIVLLLTAISVVNAQQLSTASGRGRQIKNDMLTCVNAYRYKIIDYTINTPPQRSFVLVKVKEKKKDGTIIWVPYLIERHGDVITMKRKGKTIAKRNATVK